MRCINTATQPWTSWKRSFALLLSFLFLLFFQLCDLCPLSVLTPSMRGIPALHSTQQACWISSLATSSCLSSYADWMFSRVGEGNRVVPGAGPCTSDALAPISSPGPDSTARQAASETSGQMVHKVFFWRQHWNNTTFRRQQHMPRTRSSY